MNGCIHIYLRSRDVGSLACCLSIPGPAIFDAHRTRLIIVIIIIIYFDPHIAHRTQGDRFEWAFEQRLNDPNTTPKERKRLEHSRGFLASLKYAVRAWRACILSCLVCRRVILQVVGRRR